MLSLIHIYFFCHGFALLAEKMNGRSLLPAGEWGSGFFHMPVFQVHRSGAAKDGDADAQFAFFGVDFFDCAFLALERAFADSHGIACLLYTSTPG